MLGWRANARLKLLRSICTSRAILSLHPWRAPRATSSLADSPWGCRANSASVACGWHCRPRRPGERGRLSSDDCSRRLPLRTLSTTPGYTLNATFAPAPPPRGRIGFMSQSGALGLAVIDHARRVGLGLSTFVSVGNKADISGNDLLDYWESDPRTDLVLLYL